jgi:hypothetical protein
MFRKQLLTSSLLLPLMAVSGLAHAGPTITDKNYWPNEVGPGAYRTTPPQAGQTSSWAAEVGTPRARTAPEMDNGQRQCRYLYRGGPRSPVTC